VLHFIISITIKLFILARYVNFYGDKIYYSEKSFFCLDTILLVRKMTENW